MIHDEIVTYEVAKLAKKKGFNLHCVPFYALEDFTAEYVDDEGYDVEIFKIVDRQGRDRYFKIDATKDWMPTEVIRVSKMVEIISWEEQK